MDAVERFLELADKLQVLKSVLEDIADRHIEIADSLTFDTAGLVQLGLKGLARSYFEITDEVEYLKYEMEDLAEQVTNFKGDREEQKDKLLAKLDKAQQRVALTYHDSEQ